MDGKTRLALAKYLVIMSLFGASLLAFDREANPVQKSQTSSKKSSAAAKPASERSAKPQAPAKDVTHFLLTGTAVHEDGSAWEGLGVVLFTYDKEAGKSRVGFGLNPETGHVELGNPNAKTNAQGRFSIRVHRGYLERDAEETEFRIGRLETNRGTVAPVEMKQKDSEEPLTLKIKKDVEVVDLGEIW